MITSVPKRTMPFHSPTGADSAGFSSPSTTCHATAPASASRMPCAKPHHQAQALPPGGRTSREVHRHIGDYTLFWTGLYPEALKRLRSVLRKDHFIDYCEQGKRSYYIASTFEDDRFRDEAAVLRRLSEEFELVAYGLNQVRREWDRTGPDAGPLGLAALD